MRPMLTAAMILALAACPPSPEGDPNLVVCEFDEVVVAWDEAAPDGTVPDDVLALAEGNVATTGGYMDRDEEVDVTASLARRGDNAVFYVSTVGGCPDYLGIPVTVTFVTGDGAFDEQVEVEATLGELGGAGLQIQADLPLARVEGSLDLDPGTEAYGVNLIARFTEGAVSGEVEVLLQGGDTDGGGDGAVWASRENFFVFGAR